MSEAGRSPLSRKIMIILMPAPWPGHRTHFISGKDGMHSTENTDSWRGWNNRTENTDGMKNFYMSGRDLWKNIIKFASDSNCSHNCGQRHRLLPDLKRHHASKQTCADTLPCA